MDDLADRHALNAIQILGNDTSGNSIYINNVSIHPVLED